jgi:hypothetical protein
MDLTCKGGWGKPYKAYGRNKMKASTRILVGGPEVTTAFVLSELAHVRELLHGRQRRGIGDGRRRSRMRASCCGERPRTSGALARQGRPFIAGLAN